MATPRRNHYAPQNTWSEEQIVEPCATGHASTALPRSPTSGARERAPIQRWHDEHGRSPSKNEWEVAPEGYPPAATVRRAFRGSFVKAVNAAGFAQAKRIWTQPMILEAIREFSHRHGRLPRRSEWTLAAPGRPTRGTVVNRFGSWTAAMALARPDQPG